MKLVGELKDKVEKAQDLEEAKKAIEEAGMQLTDAEMDAVAGGAVDFDKLKKQEDLLLRSHKTGSSSHSMV